VPALGHRLILKPEYWAQDVTEDMVVREVLDSVPTPPVVPPTAP
jgi:MoxR-like ATPase